MNKMTLETLKNKGYFVAYTVSDEFRLRIYYLQEKRYEYLSYYSDYKFYSISEKSLYLNSTEEIIWYE